MEIYRGYTSEELTEEIADLRKHLKGSLSAQGSGSVTHQRDTNQLENRLQAAQRVKNERANRNRGNPNKGQVDFRGGRWGSL